MPASTTVCEREGGYLCSDQRDTAAALPVLPSFLLVPSCRPTVLPPRATPSSSYQRPCSSTWICSLVPAVMLEMVQHASFLMLFLWLVVSRLSRQGSAPQLMMICG